MATRLGKSTVIMVGTSDPPSDTLELARNPELDETVENEDTTTNDTGDGKNRDPVRKDAKLRVNVYADKGATGQGVLNTALDNMTKVWVIIRPEGTGSALLQKKARFVVDGAKLGMPLNGRQTIDYMLSLDGEIDNTAQAS